MKQSSKQSVLLDHPNNLQYLAYSGFLEPKDRINMDTAIANPQERALYLDHIQGADNDEMMIKINHRNRKNIEDWLIERKMLYPRPTSLKDITFLTNENIRHVVNLWCEGSKEVLEKKFGHISKWDVSRVTDMSWLFVGQTTFDDNISEWDVSNVTRMKGMFHQARAFNQPLNQWNVSSVTDMSLMFRHTQHFCRPLDSWDVSQVTNMRQMFDDSPNFNWINGMFQKSQI